MKTALVVGLALVAINVMAAPKLEIKLSQDDERVSKYSCEKVEGFLAPYEKKKKMIKFAVELTGTDENVELSVKYTNHGYKKLDLDRYVSYKTDKMEVEVPYYELKDDLGFVVNNLFVSTKLSDGTAISAAFNYKVMRSLILEKSPDDSDDCFTMYKASMLTGPLTNTSTQPRTVTISDSLGKSKYNSNGTTKGWTFKFSLFNIVEVNRNVNHVTSKTSGVDANTEIRVSTTVAPDEVLILTRQATLFKDAYTVYNVDNCGKMDNAGTAYYNYWLVTYPVARLDMSANNPFADLDVGYDDQMSTCQEVSDSDDDDVFIPDVAEVKTVSIEIEDHSAFNEMGKDLTSSNETKNKNIFVRAYNKLFK